MLLSSAFALWGVATAGLLWIPNDFWKGQTIAWERVIIVDNLAQAPVLATRPISDQGRTRQWKSWIELEDGRRLEQTQYVQRRYRDRRETPRWHGAYVALEAAPSDDGREWYKVTHYKENYIPEASMNPKFVIPLSTRRIDMYSEVSRQTYAYVR